MRLRSVADDGRRCIHVDIIARELMNVKSNKQTMAKRNPLGHLSV